MKLMIIDGNSILNRAFYAIRPLSAPDGTPTNAIFGFMNIFHKYLSEQQPDSVAVCFDVSKKTFRNEIYSDYKGTRKGMPDELRAQLQPVKDILNSLGYLTIGLEGFEADDLIGTLSTAAAKSGNDCVIVTGDRDSLQLVDERVTVLLPATKAGKTETTVYTPDTVLENIGVRPDQIVDLKALMGDSSDNIPGVAGIGQKGAVDLISKFESIDNLFASLETADIKPAAKAKLEAGQESAYLSKTLATINREAPIDTNIESYKIKEANKTKAAAILTRLGLIKIMAHYGLSASDAPATEVAEEKPLELTKKNYTLVRYAPLSDVKAAAEGGEVYYLFKNGVIYLAAGDKIFVTDDVKGVFSLELKKYTYDCKEQYLFALKNSLPLPEVYFDLKLAAYLISPTDSDYGFASLTTKYGKGEYTLSFTAEFGDDEAAFEEICQMFFLCKTLYSELKKAEMLPLLSDIEIPLSETLSAMEFEGFELNREGIREFDRTLAAEMERLRQSIYALAGEEFNLNSPKQLGEILFERLSLPAEKKTKTGYSTSAEVLEHLKKHHPIINEILEYRKVSKLKSTYTEGLLAKLGEKERIHTTFLQTETRTGRLSSVEPNLQNIPVRTELGSRLREFFVAPEGRVLVDADYSQIELRVLAHVADDKAMQQAFKSGADIHTATAARVYGLPEMMITPELRRSAKAVNFGIVYGIGAYSLSQDIKTTVAEASRLIKSYLDGFSGVADYMKKTVENGERDGFVSTLYGRRRVIPELKSKNKVLHALGERVAMNTPIQGTAADIIKIAMNKVYKALKSEVPDAKLILQVHDELIVECSDADAEKVEKILTEQMRSAATLKVELETDVHVGKTWLEAKG
ncbi:MAG: DNA polymerase I [Oscillospiraceae bacterium]|nr:DNA polymerase I [Oscillospiraceae bacterium]